ncbi:MAG: aminopeptidase [Proteobacteria bacterium]|nr:aminopeptidase [Pseudomonadota bacterium]
MISLHGCYYVQAARGQFEVMRSRESIADVIRSDETPVELGDRLRVVEQARVFSIDVLGLPDNDSYRSYADLERDYVIWNVIAVPEFSLQPKRWCYPIVGCVSYRGYFSEQAAKRKAARLRANGYDVAFGGVAAYSTLGRFNDPILNTMMHWDDVDLVAVMFHELAHQLIYIKDDSAFNESFATAVEQTGIERWLALTGNVGELDEYYDRIDRRQRLMQLVDAAREDLRTYYSNAIGQNEKRRLKADRITRLEEDIRAEFTQAGQSSPTWLEAGLNNARIASLVLYNGHVPAFRALLRQCKDDLRCFYAEAKTLSNLDKETREAGLAALKRPG